MCRLLGVAGSSPERVAEVLGASDGFCELSHKHADGWGVAWHDAGGLRIVKGTLPAWQDPAYEPALAQVEGDAAIVHLRRASPGLPVVLENCHPFGEGVVAFEHHGQFRVTDRLRAFHAENGLRPLAGTTDSELYFALVLGFATRTGSWPAAIVEAAAFITSDQWLDDPSDNPESLNCLLLTPDALYGYSQHEPAKLKPDAPLDTYVLRIAQRDGVVELTSTHWDVAGAEDLPQRCVVEVARGSLDVAVHPQAPLGGVHAAA